MCSSDLLEANLKVENALGVASENGGGGSNAKALRLLTSGFKNNPPVYYYQGGDTPTLPDELEGMITADNAGAESEQSGASEGGVEDAASGPAAAAGEHVAVTASQPTVPVGGQDGHPDIRVTVRQSALR